MSVNIWGSGIKKESTGNVDISSFIKKSGDIMKGVLNMGDNRIVSISNPENNTDAVNKRYCDNTFLHRIVENNVLKLGTSDNTSVELIMNNEPYLTMSDNYINVNRKLLLNLREPIGDSEAVSKRYFDNNTVRIGGNTGLPNQLNIGTLDEKYVRFIRNNELYIHLNNDIEILKPLDMNRRLLYNLKDPINPREAAHKQYVDDSVSHIAVTDDNLIIISKSINMENNSITNLKEPLNPSDATNKQYIDELISKNDTGVVFIKRDTDSYINLNNNMINIDKDLNLNNGVRIHNVPNPINNTDPVNKVYFDNNRLSKNYVGYIPLNPIPYGFLIQTTIESVGQNILTNILNDDLNSVWEATLTNNPFFIITCPNRVIVWKISMILPNNDIPYNFDIDIYGIDDDGARTSIKSGISSELFNGEVILRAGIDFRNENIDLDRLNRIKFYKYRIEFTRKNQVDVSFKIIRFQMFVYND